MNTAENKRLLQEIFAGLAVGDSRLFVESMADDFRWIMIGTTTWSRTYDGKQAVLDELLKPLRARFEGRIKTVPLHFIAEDDLVVVEARGNNMLKNGKPYNNTYCFVFRLAGGKLRELTEYLDTQLVIDTLGERD